MTNFSKATKVTSKPTADMMPGLYKVVDGKGIFWGYYMVAKNWCGEKFVMDWNN